MKHNFYFLTLSLLVMFLNASAQAPNWQWANGAGGTDSEVAEGVYTDANGNVYVTGAFRSATITFGSTVLTNTAAGVNDMFLVKYDASGNVVWAIHQGGSDVDYGAAVRADANGNVFVTGAFKSSTLVVGSTTLTNSASGMADVFVIKYDANGAPVWAKSFGGADQDYSTSLSLDASGNIYVCGQYSSASMSVGSTNVVGNGNSDIFVASLDPQGSVLWADGKGGSDADVARDIATDDNGNLYVTGFFKSSSLAFGSTTLTNSTTTTDVLLLKYSTSGSPVWAKSASGSGNDNASSIAVDGNGNAFISGGFGSPTLSFGTTTVNNVGMASAFVVKYDAAGNTLWAQSAGGTGVTTGEGVSLDDAGNIYLGGGFTVGMTVGTSVLTNAGGIDMYVAQFDASGNPVWAISGGSTGSDLLKRISANGSGSVAAVGSFTNASATFGTTTITNAGSSDMYVAKFVAGCSSAPVQPTTVIGEATACANNSQTYSVNAVSGATSYNWTLPNGWTGTSTSNSIVTTVGTSGGTISVSAVNACGTSPAQTFEVTVNAAPDPVVTASANQLSTASAQGTYQWFLNGAEIAGATNETYTATQNGDYYVVVTNSNGCSGQSNTVNVTGLGVHGIDGAQSFSMFPNPVSDLLTIQLDGSGGRVRVVNGLGQTVFVREKTSDKLVIDVADLTPGIYQLRLDDSGSYFKNFIKQ